MSFEIIPTSNFAKELKALAKKYPKIKGDIEDLSKELSEDPKRGTPLGRDCFKIRMQITGKQSGKSGGARIIIQVKIIAEQVYLLSIYDKGDQEMNDALDDLLSGL